MTPATIKGLDECLTPAEAAAVLKRPVRYVVRTLIKGKALKASRVGNQFRIRPTDLTNYLRATQVR